VFALTSNSYRLYGYPHQWHTSTNGETTWWQASWLAGHCLHAAFPKFNLQWHRVTQRLSAYSCEGSPGIGQTWPHPVSFSPTRGTIAKMLRQARRWHQV